MMARTAMKDFKSLTEPIEKISSTWFACPPRWTQAEVEYVNEVKIARLLEKLPGLGKVKPN
jgi:hypothetical protein